MFYWRGKNIHTHTLYLSTDTLCFAPMIIHIFRYVTPLPLALVSSGFRCGDTFMGALAAAVCLGKDMREAAEIASEAAALSAASEAAVSPQLSGMGVL
jgi:hypothetical protein